LIPLDSFFDATSSLGGVVETNSFPLAIGEFLVVFDDVDRSRPRGAFLGLFALGVEIINMTRVAFW